MIPFEVLMSALTTFALLIIRDLPDGLIVISAPLTVLAESSLAAFFALTFPGTTW